MSVLGTPSRFRRSIAHALARSLVALLLLSHALLALSSTASPSHDPLRAIPHAHESAHAASDRDEHGHSHEDLDDEAGTHLHGHSPADHSHDKPNMPPTDAARVPLLSDQWLAEEHRLVYPYNTDLPNRADLPSTGRLLRSTALAALIAGGLLVTTVLPAEYRIDPTGIGRVLGLTAMK